MSIENQYMQQVMVQQAEVEADLRGKRVKRKASFDDGGGGGDFGGSGPEGPAVDVRVTGWLRWKTVVVPPNAYVVHTRRGHAEPLHCGLGTSFRYNPVKDSYLVVPAAMQTIVINANCICKERQGILVQGYVQWVIDDFKTAYRRLDFSDVVDPMRVVNVQLREQAEAVIKDTVATMTLDNVLSDRQPIIRELTTRLRQLMEGDGGAESGGLGLRIVTVQIKEAIVSSATLWETLQRAFRAERTKIARLAELDQQAAIREREAREAEAAEATRIETDAVIHRRRVEAEAAAFDQAQAEQARRAALEAETVAASTAHQIQIAERQAELERLRTEQTLAIEQLRHETALARERQEIELAAARRAVDNDLSPVHLQAQLVAALPEIAERMPRPRTLRSIQLGGLDGLGGLIEGLTELVGKLGNRTA